MSEKVEIFFEKLERWRAESLKLRALLLNFPFKEELKWGEPCYTCDGKNVVLIGGFKEFTSLLFFKGSLMADPKGLLATPGQVQVGRQMRFTSVRQIVSMDGVIKNYIAEAIEIEKSGLRPKLKTHSDYKIPEGLQRKLNSMPKLKRAFEALTPGRQRGYMFHIARPKLAKTREARVEQCIPIILNGKGLND